jgi:hypothetical protein
MEPETAESPAYLARFGFDQRTVLVLAVSVVFVLLMVWLPTDPRGAAGMFRWLGSGGLWAVKVAGLLLFGAGGAVFAFVAARGGVALNVDRQGITLGNPKIGQPGMTNQPVQVTWDDVTEVVLFDQYHAGGRQPYLGVRLRRDARATATTFNPESRLWSTNRKLMGHVPEDILVRSRPVSGWRLDEQRLSEAITSYAPHVRVVRLDNTGTAHPVATV